jgi:hypothetical protein
MRVGRFPRTSVEKMFSDGSNIEINKAYQGKSGRPKQLMQPSGNIDAGTIDKFGLAKPYRRKTFD